MKTYRDFIEALGDKLYDYLIEATVDGDEYTMLFREDGEYARLRIHPVESTRRRQAEVWWDIFTLDDWVSDSADWDVAVKTMRDWCDGTGTGDKAVRQYEAIRNVKPIHPYELTWHHGQGWAVPYGLPGVEQIELHEDELCLLLDVYGVALRAGRDAELDTRDKLYDWEILRGESPSGWVSSSNPDDWPILDHYFHASAWRKVVSDYRELCAYLRENYDMRRMVIENRPWPLKELKDKWKQEEWFKKRGHQKS